MKTKPSTFKVKTIRGFDRFTSHKNALEFAKDVFETTGRVVVLTEVLAGGVENTIATFAPTRNNLGRKKATPRKQHEIRD